MAAKHQLGRELDLEFLSLPENSGNVPAFLSKLWTLVEDPSNNDIICWDAKGNSFHIFDQSRFASDVLPYYFKHNNISSFIRQLNMYGFRKVQNLEQGNLKVERNDLEFQHQFFVRGHEELLELIKRKTGQSRTEQRSMTFDSDQVSKILGAVTQIKNRQESVHANLNDLKRENQVLWQEVLKMKKKSMQQEQILNKLLQFLLSLVNKHGRGMTGLTRKRPLMIDSGPQHPNSAADGPAPKKANMGLDLAGDHDYTVESPSSIQTPTSAVPSASGVVIQELLDHIESSPSVAVNTYPQSAPSAVVTEPVGGTIFTSSSQSSDPMSGTTGLPTIDDQSLQNTALSSVPAKRSVHKAQPDTMTSTAQQPLPQPAESTSNQIALRGAKDRPLSASSNSKDLQEQMVRLQCDLDSVRDVLSSGQFNLDSNFLLKLFDPETPLPVDSSFLEALVSGEADSTAQTSSTTGPVASSPHPAENITGNELSQYQPSDLSFPSLFEELDPEPVGTDSPLPVYFNYGDSDVLNTPTIREGKPDLSDEQQYVSVEDVD